MSDVKINGKPLILETANDTDSSIIFNRFYKKYNHRFYMSLTKVIGRFHLKIPKQSRKRWIRRK